PDKKIPDFWRLTPMGAVTTENAYYTGWSGHHFCLSSRGDLVLTEEVLLFLKSFALNYCDITPLKRA
ncbi:hypothetical protein COJ52_29825, partial [Bacillus cereus]